MTITHTLTVLLKSGGSVIILIFPSDMKAAYVSLLIAGNMALSLLSIIVTFTFQMYI